MNAMTCAQVQEQLDLVAADACDAPTRQALERHLDHCQECGGRYAESQRLLALLDLHWNQQGVARLRQRVEQQARQVRRPFLPPFAQRAVALAAMVLIAVGLVRWLQSYPDPGIADRQSAEPQFALLVPSEQLQLPIEQKIMAMAMDHWPKAVREKDTKKAFPPLPEGPKRNQFQMELMKAQLNGKLQPPTALALTFTLVNTGKRTVEIHLGDTVTELSLEVKGGAVVRVPAPKEEKPAFLQEQTLHLAPGKQHVLRMDRLLAGSRGHLEYVYLTAPGEYTVIPRLRFTADGRVRTVTGETVRIQVSDRSQKP